MAGRGRMRMSQQPGVALFRPQGPGGGGGGSRGAGPPIIEQKLAAQHLEIQRLLTENQRFAASHVALRQEIAAAQHELLQLRQLLPDKDAKILNLESDLDQARSELKSLSSHRQELLLQAQQLGQDLHRDSQQMNLLRAENDALRQELQRSRGSSKQQPPEPDLAKEVDKLRSIVSSTSTYASESWTTHYAPNGAPFYYNTISGVTQWERPASLLSASAGATPLMSPHQVNSLQQTLQQLMQQGFHQQQAAQQQGFHLSSTAAPSSSASQPPVSVQAPPSSSVLQLVQQLMYAAPQASSPKAQPSQKPLPYHSQR